MFPPRAPFFTVRGGGTSRFPHAPSPAHRPAWPMSAVRRWDALTREEIAALAPEALLVLPVGSTEQHGPHLATGTDALIATAIAERAAAAAASPPTILLAPTLAYGASAHHLPFGGTLSLDVATFQLVLRDLLASAASAGVGRVFVLNGHGGNAAACAIAVAEASRELGLLAATRDAVGPRRRGRDRRSRPGARRKLRDVARARPRSGPRPAGARASPRRADRLARGRADSSSASPDAGRSSTATPTGRTRPRSRAASRRSRRASPRLRQHSSSSPTSVDLT